MDPQINVRIPELLKVQLEDAAKNSGLSVTAEVVQRLQASFPETLVDRLIGRRQEELKWVEEWLNQARRMASRMRTAGDAKELNLMQHRIGILEAQWRRINAEMAALIRALDSGQIPPDETSE